MRAVELVRLVTTANAETVRRISKAALSRLERALEDRGVIPKPWEPVVPHEELVQSEQRWGPSPPSVPGIDLSQSRQLELLDHMGHHATDLPDFRAGSFRYRYHPQGSTLPLPEALALHLIIRTLRPKRIFELGSAQGRAVMLDTVERSAKEFEIVSVERGAPAERWRELAAGDLLYAESHDLAPLLFDVLPSLRAGTYIQLRPVAYPFVRNDLLRAFLQYNRDFQIRFWPSYLYQHCRDRLSSIPQICSDAASLLIRKVG